MLEADDTGKQSDSRIDRQTDRQRARHMPVTACRRVGRRRRGRWKKCEAKYIVITAQNRCALTQTLKRLLMQGHVLLAESTCVYICKYCYVAHCVPAHIGTTFRCCEKM